VSLALYPNHFIPRCQHIKTNGTQCGSPSLKRKKYCFFHHRWRETRLDLNNAGALRLTTTVVLPVLEDADSIQVALMQVMRLMLCRQIEHKTAGLLLYALQTASSNLRHAHFEPLHKSDVLIDPTEVTEIGVGDPAWSTADFDENEEGDENEEEDEGEEESKNEGEVEGKEEGEEENKDSKQETKQAPKLPNYKLPNYEIEAKELNRIQTAFEGAQRGNGRDLKTVLEFAGIFPPKDGESTIGT
jgi:hypothetical protein